MWWDFVRWLRKTAKWLIGVNSKPPTADQRLLERIQDDLGHKSFQYTDIVRLEGHIVLSRRFFGTESADYVLDVVLIPDHPDQKCERLATGIKLAAQR